MGWWTAFEADAIDDGCAWSLSSPAGSWGLCQHFPERTGCFSSARHAGGRGVAISDNSTTRTRNAPSTAPLDAEPMLPLRTGARFIVRPKPQSALMRREVDR